MRRRPRTEDTEIQGKKIPAEGTEKPEKTTEKVSESLKTRLNDGISYI